MKIRRARIEDIEDIEKIDRVSLKADHSIDYFRKNLNNTIVAIEEGKVIGYFMFKDQLAMNIVVHPDYRNRGIGEMLFKEATKQSRRFISRTREDNVNALEFLKHLGFKYKRKIKNYYKNGDNAIEMEWNKT
jgi:ribosomal protein S18 acetylase RimI-like enzyme